MLVRAASAYLPVIDGLRASGSNLCMVDRYITDLAKRLLVAILDHGLNVVHAMGRLSHLRGGCHAVVCTATRHDDAGTANTLALGFPPNFLQGCRPTT